MHLHLPHIFGLSGFGGAESILTLATVFTFVIIMVAIRSYTRLQRQKLWHETARSALEKGQPLPPNFGGRGWGYQGAWPLYRGLIWIAAGVGLHFVNRPGIQDWAPLPICIGAAFLVVGVISLARSNSSSNPQNPADRV
jgi:hypothetical protein